MTHCFDVVQELSGVAKRDEHKIIGKWPLRLKLHVGGHVAQEEFDLLMESGHTGCERYVEWMRTSGVMMEM
jgi:hypothetical protein